MENKINDSCGGRGCRVIILTHDSGIKPIYSNMFSTKYGFPKILSLVNISLDEKLEKEESLEKNAA